MKAPKLRFINFKDELQEKKLGSIVDIFRGASPRPKSDPRFYGGPIPRLMIEDVTRDGKYVTPKVDSLTLEGAKKSRLLSKGALVLSCSGTRVAIPGILNVDACIHDGFFGFKNFKELDKDYLFYFFEKLHESIQASATKGATFNNLTTEIMKTMTFILPSLLEQKKIASFFSTLDKKIQLQQQKIDLLQEQKKGYMQKIFNRELRFKDEKGNIYPEWKEGILEDVLFLKLREVPKPKTSYIRLGLRSHAKGTFHQLVTNPEEVSMDKLYVVKKGDLVINITFAWEQALAIAESNDEDKLVSHRFPTYSFKENQYNQFYKYYLTTKYFKYALGNASPGGAGRNRVLNKKDFLKIKLSYPCFKEQSIIADFLDKLDCKVFTELKKLELLQKQKQGFMQQMFI